MLLKMILSLLALAALTGAGILALNLLLDRMDFDDWSAGKW